MKRLTRATGSLVLAVVTAVGSVAVAAPASASPNINRVSCGNRTDWLRIFSDATTCWANPGLVKVKLYNVYEWCPGNNSGYLVTSRGNQGFSNNRCGVFGGGKTGTVTEIEIYG